MLFMCHNTGCKLQTQHPQYQHRCQLCPSSVSVLVGLMLAALCQLSASSHEAADMQQGSWFTQDSGQLHRSKRGYSHHVGLIKPHEQPGVMQHNTLWSGLFITPLMSEEFQINKGTFSFFKETKTTCEVYHWHISTCALFLSWSCYSTILILSFILLIAHFISSPFIILLPSPKIILHPS